MFKGDRGEIFQKWQVESDRSVMLFDGRLIIKGNKLILKKLRMFFAIDPIQHIFPFFSVL